MDDWNVSHPFLDVLFSGVMLNFGRVPLFLGRVGYVWGGVGTCNFLGPGTKASEKLVS